MNDRSYLQLIRDPGFGWMLVTQFLAALNDNVYRFIVVFYVIAHRPADANLYITLIAALFVLPYLMFSGYAGQLADSFSKRTEARLIYTRIENDDNAMYSIGASGNVAAGENQSAFGLHLSHRF